MGRLSSRAAVQAALPLLLAAAALAAPIAHAGVWDPFELEPADLARRVAVDLLGADQLGLPDDPAAPPTLGDLKMGELPSVSMALAFASLGLRAWVGRLPFLLFAVVGAAVTWALVARFAGRRAALFSLGVLVTCPLFALHARSMTGDGATMAAFALASAGLGGASLERRRTAAAAWGVVAAVGLIAGWACRGALLGLGAPLLGAALAALASPHLLPAEERRRRFALAIAGLASGLVASVAFFLRAAPIAAAGDELVVRTVGMALPGAAPGEGTFDRVIRHIGLATFPWSAFAPFAIGKLLAPPSALSARDPDPATSRMAALRLHALSSLGVCFLACASVTPWAGDLPFPGVASLAIVIGLALDDLAEGPAPSPVAAVGVGLLALLLTFDLTREPDRMLAAFARPEATWSPAADGWEPRALTAIAVAFAAALALALVGASPPATDGEGRLAGIRSRARAIAGAARAVTQAWEGWLAFALVVVEAALVGLAAMVLVGERLEWTSITGLSRFPARVFLHGFWLVPLAAVGVPSLLMLAREAASDLARRAGVSTAALAGAVACAASGLLSFGVHPAIAAQLSPTAALEAFEARRGAGDSLGLLGLSERLGLFHGGGEVRAFAADDDAFEWLASAQPRATGGHSRWLVLRTSRLGELNALHRARFGRNLPVAEASPANVLATSDLGDAADRSPLADVVLDREPAPARPRAARLEESLEILGWEVVDRSGRAVDQVTAREPYRVRVFVRTLAPLAPGYRPFLHVDRGKLRWNGDEAWDERGYPQSLWQPDDVVVLQFDMTLEANFGKGGYEVYFGFFSGAARMSVTEGPASADRVRMGVLQVE